MTRCERLYSLNIPFTQAKSNQVSEAASFHANQHISQSPHACPNLSEKNFRTKPKFGITLLHVLSFSISYWVLHYSQWKKDQKLVHAETQLPYTFRLYIRDTRNVFDWQTRTWKVNGVMLNPRIRKNYINESYRLFVHQRIDTNQLITLLQIFNPKIPSIYTNQAFKKYHKQEITLHQYIELCKKIKIVFTNNLSDDKSIT